MDTDDPVFDENDASPERNISTEVATDRSSEGMQITKICFLATKELLTWINIRIFCYV